MPTRFAPSPTGYLHLGHAFSAITAWNISQKTDKKFILRIEDIDSQRCKVEYEKQILDDLEWLGLTWVKPVIRQKNRINFYKEAIDILNNKNLIYPCSCTRKDINEALSAPQGNKTPKPYPGLCRNRSMSELKTEDNIRINLDKSINYLKNIKLKSLSFVDNYYQKNLFNISFASKHLQEDIIVARKDIGTSYHLSVVVDDAFQNITHVVRGADLFNSTPIQRLLQELLELPQPLYHHHRLILDENGKRLAKREASTALSILRESGVKPIELKRSLDLIN